MVFLNVKRNIDTAFHVPEQYLRTSVGIAVRLVMIEGDTVVIAHHIEVMLHIGKNTPADLDRTQVLRTGVSTSNTM